MKGKNRDIVLTAALAAATLAFALGASAAGEISISVDPAVRITIEGQDFQPKDANGQDVQVFIYNGTTYAPLRALAEAYGLQAGWDPSGKVASVSRAAQDADAEIRDGDFVTREYVYESSAGYSMCFATVRSNSSATVNVTASATAYDASGNAIGAANGSIEVLGPGETSVAELYFQDVSGISRVECRYSYSRETTYSPVVGNLAISQSVNESNVVLQVANNGPVAARFVHAYAIFLDAGGRVVGYDSKYFVDGDSEIKPGAAMSGQMNSSSPFASVEVFFTGRSQAS